MHRALTATLLASAVTAMTAGADWAQWRGPDGTGAAPDANPPSTWSETENVKWKTAIPGQGHASPIVLGDRIYVLSAIKTERTSTDASASLGLPNAVASMQDGGRPGRGQDGARPGRGGQDRGGRRPGRGGGRGESPKNVYEFVALAINRENGEIVWQTTVTEAVPHEGTHGTGSFAANSPVTDGEHLYAFFGSRGIHCLTLDGDVVWGKDLGDMRTRNSFGEGASPAVHDDVVVIPWDHEGDSYVVGLNKKDGEEIWRQPREEATTWTTPVIIEVDGVTQAVVAGTTAAVSYELKTGKEIWRCSGLTTNVIPTPVVGHGMIYLTSGYRGSALLAVDLSKAKGDITDSDAINWSVSRGTPYVPSPLLSGRNIYYLRSNNGIISCHDAITGEEHYTGHRLDGVGTVYASPVAGGGNVYVCSREGEVVVLKDQAELEVVSTISMGEAIDASPAIVGDELFLRTAGHLYCIAEE